MPAVTLGGSDATPEKGKRKRSRPTLKNWRVRRRLFAIILIPTITAGAFGGLRIYEYANSAIGYQHVEQQARLGTAVIQLANAMEDERDALAGYLARGKPAGKSVQAALQQRYGVTDQAIKRVRYLAGTIGSSYPASVRAYVTTIRDILSVRPEFQSAATTTQIPPLVLISHYSSVISDLLSYENEVAQGSNNATLAERVRALSALARAEDEGTQQRGILYAALSVHSFPPGSYAALVSAQAQQAADYTEFVGSASLAEQQAYNDTVSGPAVDQAATMEMQAIASGQSGGPIVLGPASAATRRAALHSSVPAQDWYSAMSATVGKMRVAEHGLLTSIATRSAALRAQAVRSLAISGGTILAVLIIVVLITVIVGRSMVRPLRGLREGALEVAGVRLPEMVRRLSEGGAEERIDVPPIPIDSTDEVGEVARAFDQVHREAVRLAANEAALRGNVNAMFMNLSRRSQSLVERQIRLIDDLEQGEQDSERLANLFQLDHLATRMRRNSENLLVLAGHDLTRRWTQAVALVDVLRAAASEIEQYERVTLNVQSGIAVRGQAVNDVVHLIAELVENATSFSAAETPVNVAGHMLGSGGVLLEITDQGVGMEDEEMAHANWRLDNPPVVDVAVSRRMGLFVVARLAARHGIRVRLRPSPRGGLTALVWLPDEVISQESTAVPPFHGTESAVYGHAASLASGSGRWQITDGVSDDHAAAMKAITAARTPRFSLSPDLGETAAFSALDADLDVRPVDGETGAYEEGRPSTGTGPLPSAAATGPLSSDASLAPSGAGTGPMPVFGAPVRGEEQQFSPPANGGLGDLAASDTSWAKRGVIVPPAASVGEANRLPIFESVESDWFRRGRRTDHTVQAGGEVALDWTSPADQGWRAAEAAYAPASGGMTRSGLPKRIPQANLVPGSAGGLADGASAPARSAAQTRQRLASFQQGVREGRAAAHDESVSGGDGGNAT